MYVREEMDEAYAKRMYRIGKVIARLPIYGAHLNVLRKKKILRAAGAGYIWTGPDECLEGKSIDECFDYEINNAVICLGAEIREYLAEFREWKLRQEKRPVQKEFEFVGRMWDIEPVRDRLSAEEIAWIFIRR